MQPKTLWFLRTLFLLFLLLSFVDNSTAQRSDTPPQQLLEEDFRLYDVDLEQVGESYPGLLAIVRKPVQYKDGKYNKPYSLACHVYIATPSEDGSRLPTYKRRFLVCAATKDALPFVKQVARLLLIFCAQRRIRFGTDHPSSQPTVNVWITEQVEQGLSPDTGGEQFQNQIYLYNRHLERSVVEWAREIAHEYGHYGLPGISGYTKPEEWANGTLGERLFLKWLWEDMRSGRVPKSDIPFVNRTELEGYYKTEIYPLMKQIMINGTEARKITRRDAEGMDYFTGLCLYIDALYGTKMLASAFQETQSPSRLTLPHAPEFLNGFLRAVLETDTFELTPNEPYQLFYLPAGSWEVNMVEGVSSWKIQSGSNQPVKQTAKGVQVQKSAWYRLVVTRGEDSRIVPRLLLRKRSE